jgi:tetratricopeptide (TPR) repeat protein
MPEEEPSAGTGAQPDPSSEKSSLPTAEQSRRTSLTPEQRRFLGAPRSLHERPEKENPDAPAVNTEELTSAPPRAAPPGAPRLQRSISEKQPEGGIDKEQRERLKPAPVVMVDRKSSRASEMLRAFLVIGALAMLFLAFYAGKKFAYWKYLIMSRNTPALSEKGVDKFPGVSSDELIKQALVAEQSNKWQEAVERLLAAKNKDHAHRGILFRVGKLLFDHRSWENADAAFERAIVFGEDVDKANYFRGVIATQRRDLAAAARFFEAAANASPFTSQYYYFWGEVLRMNSHPRDAITRYEQAALRASSAQEEKVCRFKIRMAEAEAAESVKVDAELEIKKSAGPLSVDWLMTAAALRIREGHIDEAVRLLSQARSGTDPGLFAACVKDQVFRDASAKHPEVAKVCRLDLELPSTFP